MMDVIDCCHISAAMSMIGQLYMNLTDSARIGFRLEVALLYDRAYVLFYGHQCVQLVLL